MLLLDATSDGHHDAARFIQRSVRANRLRRFARILARLPVDVQKNVTCIACERSQQREIALQASVARVVAARFASTGKSLGHALILATSWKDAELGAHLCELRQAYTLATKYHTALSLGAIGEMMNTALFYIDRCHYDTNGDWFCCQIEIVRFTRAVLQLVPQHERREAAASMGLKRMIELTCVMIGA